MTIYDNVVARLNALGYTVTEDQEPAVSYCINLATENVKVNINRKDIPDELYYTLVDMAAGLFLKDLKDTGRIGGAGQAFDFTAPAKKITEGDVTVEFTGASDGQLTPEARFDKLINGFINPPQSVFAAFRRLKW